MIRCIHFLRNDKEASTYNSFLDREVNFNKLFPAKEFGSVSNLESGINQFIKENRYKSVNFGSIDETIISENDVLSLSRAEIKASVLLVIDKGKEH
jgi:hypothetical protein